MLLKLRHRFWNLLKVFSKSEISLHIKSFQNGFGYLLVKVEQKFVLFQKKRFDIVGVVFKERGGVIGRKYGSPVVTLPFFVVNDTQILDLYFSEPFLFQPEQSMKLARCASNYGTVTVGLLYKVLVFFKVNFPDMKPV